MEIATNKAAKSKGTKELFPITRGFIRLIIFRTALQLAKH